MMTSAAKEESVAANGVDYGIIMFSANASTQIMMFDVNLGLGMGSASDYDMTVPALSFGLAYDLPIQSLIDNDKLEDLKVALSAEYAMLTSSPFENGSSDIINLGLSVSYPILY